MFSRGYWKKQKEKRCPKGCGSQCMDCGGCGTTDGKTGKANKALGSPVMCIVRSTSLGWLEWAGVVRAERDLVLFPKSRLLQSGRKWGQGSYTFSLPGRLFLLLLHSWRLAKGWICLRKSRKCRSMLKRVGKSPKYWDNYTFLRWVCVFPVLP